MQMELYRYIFYLEKKVSGVGVIVIHYGAITRDLLLYDYWYTL